MFLVQVLLVYLALISAEASRLTPPVLPLIVRNPYLSTWLPNARDAPWEQWPMFWAGQPLGFSIVARTGGKTYPLLGRAHDSIPEDDPRLVDRTLSPIDMAYSWLEISGV